MLAASPGTVWEDIEKEFAILITKDGRPHSIIILTSVETRIEDVQEIIFAKARKAVREFRMRPADTGAAGLAGTDIDREIKVARRARKQGTRGD
jgi:hypothetical protein